MRQQTNASGDKAQAVSGSDNETAQTCVAALAGQGNSVTHGT